jgi:hypothetical protein
MAQNSDHYAIVIGIDGYSQLPTFLTSGRDATEFAKWLRDPDGGGLPPDNVALIISPPGFPTTPYQARPIQDDVDEALTLFGIEEERRIGKRLYFYFAGHGFGPQFDDVGMLMAPASVKKLLYNIGLRHYRSFLRATEAFDEIIFILDCCRDPRGGIETGAPKFTLAKVGTGANVQDFVLLAAVYGDQAFQPFNPSAGERRGILTQALLEGLKNANAADGLGRFTTASLSKYVMERMPELSKDAKVIQKPEIDDTQVKREVVFYTIPESQLEKIPVRIVAPPGLNGDLVLLDVHGRELDRHPAATAVIGHPEWIVNLVRNRQYQVKHSLSGPNAQFNIIDLGQVKGDSYVYNFQP